MKEVTRKDIQQDTMSHLSTQHLIQAANQAVSWREKNCESAAEDEVTQVIAAMAERLAEYRAAIGALKRVK